MNPRYCPVTQDDENTHRERKEQLMASRIRNLRLNYGVLFYSLLCVYIATLASFGIARSYWLPSKSLLKSQRMLPDFPNTLVTFTEDDQYVSSLAGEPNSPWNVLAPPGKGFIKVISPATWGLYGGYPVDDGTGSDTESYCISMYHQLHCLAIIKIALTDKHNISHSENIQRGSLSVHTNELSDHNHMMSNDSHHVDHCVDYLRQAIMCAGDTTLEKAGAINGQIGGGVDGWGVTHQCRDWQSIYSYTTKHRNGDVKGSCTVQGILRTSSTVECARDRERLLSLSDFASHPATILLASPEVKAVSSSRRAVSQETSHTYNRTQGSLVELLQTLLTARIVNEPVTLQTLQTL